MNHGRAFTSEVGRKFHPDGRLKQFPGNTVVAMLEPASAIFRAACGAQAELAAQPWGACFSCLPAPSLHMTVIELLCDHVRQASHWSSHLPLDAPLALTDSHMLKAVAPISGPKGVQMRVIGLAPHPIALGIVLEPADAASRETLNAYRDAVATASGVRQPQHDRYIFHITLAYRILTLTHTEEAELADFCARASDTLRTLAPQFALPPAELRFFDDMGAFVLADQRHNLPSRRTPQPHE